MEQQPHPTRWRPPPAATGLAMPVTIHSRCRSERRRGLVPASLALASRPSASVVAGWTASARVRRLREVAAPYHSANGPRARPRGWGTGECGSVGSPCPAPAASSAPQTAPRLERRSCGALLERTPAGGQVPPGFEAECAATGGRGPQAPLFPYRRQPGPDRRQAGNIPRGLGPWRGSGASGPDRLDRARPAQYIKRPPRE
jgi:hypothetical protein